MPTQCAPRQTVPSWLPERLGLRGIAGASDSQTLTVDISGQSSFRANESTNKCLSYDIRTSWTRVCVIYTKIHQR